MTLLKPESLSEWRYQIGHFERLRVEDPQARRDLTVLIETREPDGGAA